MASYISRSMQNVKSAESLEDMAVKYTNMLNSVANMIVNDGPIYDVWITFQMGKTKPITFNSATTNPDENLIASLRFDKTGADVANKFTLVVQYDPFKSGQYPTDRIEALDDCLAKAMSYDFEIGNTKGNLRALRGTIQYGYNSTSDTNLVSPKYTFILTNIESEVKTDSGITTYTIEGTSEISVDCDNTASFGKIEQWKLLDVIEWTLYYWYGDVNHKPSHTGDGEPTDNPYKYRIDIPEDVYQSAINTIIDVEATNGVTPWQYCRSLLDQYPLTDAERESHLYDNREGLSTNQIPSYSMFITDEDGIQTIHVAHVKPVVAKDYEDSIKTVESGNLKIDYTFTWGKQQNKNIVVGWKPEVNLKTYLIRKAYYLRVKNDLETLESDGNTEALEQYKKNLSGYNDDLREVYDAQLQLVGIPATPPVNAEVKIIPRVLESESRQAGIYRIINCSDDISTGGVYTTTLKLLRVRGFQDATLDVAEYNAYLKSLQDASTPTSSGYSSANGGGGAFGSGGGGGGRRRRPEALDKEMNYEYT